MRHRHVGLYAEGAAYTFRIAEAVFEVSGDPYSLVAKVTKPASALGAVFGLTSAKRRRPPQPPGGSRPIINKNKPVPLASPVPEASPQAVADASATFEDATRNANASDDAANDSISSATTVGP